MVAAMSGPENPDPTADRPPDPPPSEAGQGLSLPGDLFTGDATEAALLMGWLPVQEALQHDLNEVYARVRELSSMARSENTKRAYRAGWRQYEDWCRGIGVKPLSGDPGIVALYLAMLSKKVLPSTLKARLAVISVAHRLAGIKLDTRHEAIRLVWQGAAREKGLAPRRQARALHYRSLPALVDVFGDRPLDIRNKAIVLLGFAGALRRTEIAQMALEHVTLARDGLTLFLPRSKADRYGFGEKIFISPHPDARLCPIRALKAWLKIRPESGSRLFLCANRNGSFRDQGISEQTVARVVKDAVEVLGFERDDYSGHSLRAGLATSAADAGCDLKAIMTQTRLRTAKQAMTYIRDAERRRQSVTRTLFQPIEVDGQKPSPP